MRRRLTVGVVTLAMTMTTLSAPALADPVAGLPATSFPLGTPGIPKTASKSLAPGVSYFTVSHGRSKDGYTVSVVVAGKDFMSEATAQTQAEAVQLAGLTPTVVKFTRPAVADFPAADYFMVRVGAWPLSKKDEAAKVVKQLKDAGVSAKVDFQGDDGFVTTGPWKVRVIVVDPRTFRGSFRSSIGTSVSKREKVSAMAASAKALVGVNGGFFDIHTLPAFRGDPTGISVVGGKLLSEAVAGRVGLVLKGRTARVTELSSTVVAKAGDGAAVQVTGLNRVPKPDELVLYTEEIGRETPKDDGVEAVLDAAGKVTAVRDPGARVAKGTRVLHGVGAAADWLWEHAPKDATVKVTTRVTDLRTHKAIPLTSETSIIGGAIGLVRGGRTSITASRDGMANVNMILRRHPRTLAGVTKNGKLIIAVVDGRAPGSTVGASFFEAAELMRWLGARDAVNLDGGGSSAMVIGKKVVNHPSDGVERGVGDALLVVGPR
ncbi:phosphodiester glycosidase family protein [Microbispora sp. NPDC049125]|uniref:phosphodiester glycosidase family protein n=1 Tax=Microbispora sp. NPDC049125 TaxID=3154929 RepID=UPI0034651BA6